MRPFKRHKRHDRGSFQIIGTRHHCGFGNGFVRHQRAFDFRRSQPVTADIDNIVDAAHDPEIAVFVAPCAVAGKVDAFNLRPVLLAVAFVVAPNCPQHRRPGPFDHEITALICADRLAVARHDVGFDSGKRFRRGAGFGGSRARNGRDHDGAGFGLPPRIDDRTAPVADDLAIPHPRFRIDWFAYRAEQTQARKVVFQGPVLAPFDKRANRSRSGVEDVDAMTFDDVPEAIGLRDSLARLHTSGPWRHLKVDHKRHNCDRLPSQCRPCTSKDLHP